MKKEYFEIKIPSLRKIKNPWAVSTVALAVVIIAAAILFSVFYGGFGNGSVSAQKAGQSVVSFLNSNVNGTVQLQNVTEISGVYEVTVLYQNQTVPVYATTDGKYLIQSILPIQ